MSDIVIYLAVIGYAAVWVGIGAVLSPFIQKVWLLPKHRADSVMLVICFTGFALGLLIPAAVNLANSPYCCFRH